MTTTITLPGPSDGECLDRQTRQDLRSRLREARRGSQPLLITGEPGSWQHRVEADPESARPLAVELHTVLIEVYGHPEPVICHAQGPVSGFGLALLMAADLRTAAADVSVEVGDPPLSTALITGSHRLLSRQLGRARADELVWDGVRLSAQAALMRGLFTTADDHTQPQRGLDRLAALPAPARSAMKRSTTSQDVPELKRQLEYDAWLAAVATREAP